MTTLCHSICKKTLNANNLIKSTIHKIVEIYKLYRMNQTDKAFSQNKHC
ncbi:MAG: hypothetical protein H6Q13_2981 [Bacteroidetes bacterium]|jgi:hypothetical protein|nr:hypothetical protein [Bacteroidota bacterium]